MVNSLMGPGWLKRCLLEGKGVGLPLDWVHPGTGFPPWANPYSRHGHGCCSSDDDEDSYSSDGGDEEVDQKPLANVCSLNN